MGASARLMLRLQVRNGELESDGQWVYAWIGPAGVVYVGATDAPPRDADVAAPARRRSRRSAGCAARYAELANEELDVVAVALADDVDRQQVRHSAVRLLDERGLLAPDHVCDPPLEAARTSETERFVDAVAGQS